MRTASLKVKNLQMGRRLLGATLMLCLAIVQGRAQQLTYGYGVVAVGSVGGDVANAIVSDAAGNTYTTGYFYGAATFGSFILTSTSTGTNLTTAYVVKRNAAGIVQWASAFGSNIGYSVGSGIAIAGTRVYVTGSFTETTDFDPSAATVNRTSSDGKGGTANLNGYIAALTQSTGTYLYASTFAGTAPPIPVSNEFSVPVCITADALGNVYVGGTFQGSINFGTTAAPHIMTQSNNGSSYSGASGFLCKLNSTGAYVWAQQLGDAGSITSAATVTAIVVDAAGTNVYASGQFSNTVDFSASGTSSLTTIGGTDMYVLNVNASTDAYGWAKQVGAASPASASGAGIAVDGNGVYTTGRFNGTVNFNPTGTAALLTAATGATNYSPYVMKMDLTGGYIWAKSLGGSVQNITLAIAVDACGSVYTTGSFRGTADFDPGAGTQILSSGGTGLFASYVSKLDASGNYAWAGVFPASSTTASNRGLGISIDGFGNVYSTGYFQSTTKFDPGTGTIGVPSYTSVASNDIYNSKLTPYSSPVLAGSNIVVSSLTPGCYTDANGYLMFLDPLATNNKYISINPGTYTGYSFTGLASNNTTAVNNHVVSDGNGNTTALVNRMFTITDAGTNNYAGTGMTVRLYYSPADTVAAVNALGASTFPARSRWFKISTSSITNSTNVANIISKQTATSITGATFLTPSSYGTETSGIDGTVVNYVEFTGITSYSTFGYLAAKNAYILPVSLTNFTVVANGCAATLNWATASESNSSYYAVEASLDGINFAQIAKVSSKNSTIGGSYGYVAPLGNTVTYYRLKAVDNDGKYTYSSIVSITSTGACGAGVQIRVSPNPTTDIVNIQGLTTGSHIVLYSLAGQKITEKIATSSNQAINLGMYAKGVYTLQITATNGTTNTVKLVKQ